MTRVSIVLAEDHQLVREALCAMIDQSAGYRVVGQAQDGQEALAMAEELRPQIVVLDIMMPNLNGFEATARLRSLCSPPEVLILSQYDAPEYVVQACQFGAKAYLLKDSSFSELLAALDAVTRGEMYFSARLPRDEIVERLASPVDHRSELDRLTAREREVLQLVAEGNTNRKIGYLLGISVKTVEKHRFSLMEKLGKRDVASLVRFALSHGVISALSDGGENGVITP